MIEQNKNIMKHSLFSSIVLLLLSSLIFVSCEKELKECDNYLNSYHYSDCQCPAGQVMFSDDGSYNRCESLTATEWILEINDPEFPYTKLIFNHIDVLEKWGYPLPPHEFNIDEFLNFMYNGAWRDDDNTLKFLYNTYVPRFDSLGNEFLIIDLRKNKINSNGDLGFSPISNEGYFISMEFEEDKITPKNVRFNRGEPGVNDNYNVVSYSEIIAHK